MRSKTTCSCSRWKVRARSICGRRCASARQDGGICESKAGARIRRMTNAHNSEPVVPARGRFASFTVWLENLPADCDLIGLDVRVGGEPATPCYIGPPESDGLQQLNVLLREVPTNR